MLEDDLDLDWGNWKEPNGREEKRTTLTVVFDQGLAKKAQETKGIVMQTKGIVMQTKGIVMQTKGIVMQTKSW